jgi:hypothetical protein
MSASLWVKMPAHHTPTVELPVDGIDTTRQQHAALRLPATGTPKVTTCGKLRARQK